MARNNNGQKTDKESPKLTNNIVASEAARIESNLFDSIAVPGKGPRPGRPIPVATMYKDNRPGVNFKMTIPSLAQIRFAPTCGAAKSISDPINVAGYAIMKEIQLALRQRKLTYEVPDVMKLLEAVDSLSMLWEFGKRGYAAIAEGSTYNMYFPTALATACGVDYESWSAARPQIRATFTRWAAILKNVNIPNVFSFSNLHQDMCASIYADGNNMKAQYYVFTPYCYYSYEEVDKANGLILKTLGGADAKQVYNITWDQYRSLMDAEIAAIMNSEDFDIITNGLYAAYPDSKTYTFDDVLIDIIPRVYSVEMLESLRNATIIDVVPEDLASAIVPVDSTAGYLTTGNIAVRFPTNAQHRGFAPACVFNVGKDTVSSGDIANYARWHLTLQPITGAGAAGGLWDAMVSSYGTEILLSMIVIASPTGDHWYTYYDENDEVIAEAGPATNPCYAFNAFVTDTIDFAPTGRIPLFTSFKYHPILWTYTALGDAELLGTYNIASTVLAYTEWENYFVLSEADVDYAHDMWVIAAYSKPAKSAAATTPDKVESEKKEDSK